MAFVFSEISKKHDRDSFDCGVDPLNTYLKRFARQNHENGISVTIVACADDDPKKILGYYSVSSGEVAFGDLPDGVKKKLPKYPVPVMRIGRLAVDQSTKGTGLGRQLLVDALHRALDAAKIMGIFAVVVDAKDDGAKSFYKKYGFIEFKDRPMVLFIAIETVRDSLS